MRATRRRFVAAASALCVMPGATCAAIGKPTAESARVRHRLTSTQLKSLAGKRLSAPGGETTVAALRADFRRLLGRDEPRFVANLGDERPMRIVDDAVLGEGTRPGGVGHDASLFVLGPRGAMFAVVKGGPYGAGIAQYGDPAALGSGEIRHRYLEFVDLDE